MSTDLSDAPPPRPRHKRTFTGFTPKEILLIDALIPTKAREVWTKFAVKEFELKLGFQEDFIRHVETTLARLLYNCDDLAAYQAVLYSIRDKLIIEWNKTQQRITARDPKRIYYLLLEFLMGRFLDNAIINVASNYKDGGLDDAAFKLAVEELGFRLEDVLEQEPDAALGNGGLGRLAACFVDSLSTGEYAGWGYGLRYQYGIFAQKIINGYQVETPDYWLNVALPWEIPREEIKIPVDFYGHVYTDDNGKPVWEGGERVLATAYDYPIPGYQTASVSNLRLWLAKPTTEFDFNKFNSGDYQNLVVDQQRAESITAVLYPNDNFDEGKQLRLKQQYFWVAASLHDILRRFKKLKRPWREFPEQVAIQLNDTHPTLAVVELYRILIDLEGLETELAWEIVTTTFGYTNHTVMTEALETWPVPVFGNLLPRHLQLIYDINLKFLQTVEKKFPGDPDLLRRVLVIEEGLPKKVRMAYLAIVGLHKVNGVAELHLELIKTTIFKDFVKIYGGDKFTNVTNGVTPRRWLRQANPELTELIASKLGLYDFLRHLDQLKGLEKFEDDPEFLKAWDAVKVNNKKRLAKLVHELTGIEIRGDVLYDVQVKRIHEYKRQQMNIFGVIHRYLQIKKALPEERKKFQPKVNIFGGKLAPGYYAAKQIIHLINEVGRVVNSDPDVGDILKCVFVPDYNVSKAEIITPALDVLEHISTAGTEASGTSNMKFVLNGGLIIGTVDGANVEITREIGEENIFLFGNLAELVEDLRANHRYGQLQLPELLLEVFDAVDLGTFGNPDEYRGLLDAVRYHGDHYLVSDDFDLYLGAQALIDETFKDHAAWVKKSVHSVANMGFFSSDRCIAEYAEGIWNVEPVTQ